MPATALSFTNTHFVGDTKWLHGMQHEKSNLMRRERKPNQNIYIDSFKFAGKYILNECAHSPAQSTTKKGERLNSQNDL